MYLDVFISENSNTTEKQTTNNKQVKVLYSNIYLTKISQSKITYYAESYVIVYIKHSTCDLFLCDLQHIGIYNIYLYTG